MTQTSALALLLASLLLACGGATTQSLSKGENPKAALINAQLGTEYLRQNRLDDAKYKLERSLDQDQNIALAHSSYALLMVRYGEKKKARKHFKKALRLNDDDPDTYNNFGLFLCDEGDYDDALEYFEKAYKNPYYKKPEIAMANAGTCMTRTGRVSEGIAMVKRASDINPEYPYPYYQLAAVYLKNGQHGQARTKIDQFHERFGYKIQSILLGIDIARAIGDRQMAATLLGVMGRKYSSSREYREAVEELRENPIR